MLFYDCSTAPSPRRARMFIAEKGLEIETREISMLEGEQLKPEFLAVNPRATIPVLITDEGQALTENIAIAVFLEDKHPTPALFGTTADERAAVFMWNAICEGQGGTAVAEALRNGNPHMKGRALTGQRNFAQIPELAERGMIRVADFLDMLDARLDGREFLALDQFSMADITAFVFTDFARIVKIRVDDTRPNLQRWYEAMKARPSASL